MRPTSGIGWGLPTERPPWVPSAVLLALSSPASDRSAASERDGPEWAASVWDAVVGVAAGSAFMVSPHGQEHPLGMIGRQWNKWYLAWKRTAFSSLASTTRRPRSSSAALARNCGCPGWSLPGLLRKEARAPTLVVYQTVKRPGARRPFLIASNPLRSAISRQAAPNGSPDQSRP